MNVTSSPDAPPAGAAWLRDGRRVAIRELQADDEPALAAFLAGLGPRARQLRFFSGAVDIGRMTHALAAESPRRIGLVALDPDGCLIGHGLAIELGAGRAEVAIEVADGLHGEGLGTILIEQLAEQAERHGIDTFVAEVLPENGQMLDVFRDGFDARARCSDGVDTVEFPTAAWRIARERFGEMFVAPPTSSSVDT